MYKKYVVSLLIFVCSVWAEDVPKVVASIDSIKISRHQLAELLNDRYKLLDGKLKHDESIEYEVINSLQKRVVLAALEELITLELTKAKLIKLKIDCGKKDFIKEAKRAEKPFFSMYAKWGLSNPISFLDSLGKILKSDKTLNDKYGVAVKNLSLKFRLTVEDRKEMLKIWNAIEKSSLHGKARMYVFKHHSITMKNFKTRVKVNAMLRKYILQNKNSNEIKNIMDKESFALSGGVIRLSHILFFTIDPVSKKELSAEEQKKVFQKMIKMKQKIAAGASFEKMAEQYSDDETTKYKDGDLGFVPRWGMFAKEIIEEGYQSQKGDLKGPIKTEFGYHLIKVTDLKKGKDLPSAELREQATERYVAMKKEEILKKWYGDAKITRFFR